MTSTEKDQKRVENGEVQDAGEFSDAEWNLIADEIFLEWKRRKENRRDVHKQWRDIDRQLEMMPDNPHKKLPNGRPDVRKMWMCDLELPLQAQTLEVLTADARRLTIPDSGTWYDVNVELSDDYERALQGFGLNDQGQVELADNEPAARVAGQTNDIATTFLQNEANMLVSGIHDYFRSQYDFGQVLDEINAEAFKYSVGMGRVKVVTVPPVMSMASGGAGDRKKFPALVPVSIKNTYIDDSSHAVMQEGYYIDSGVIQSRRVKLADITIAAELGRTDPKDHEGGWMRGQFKGVDADRTGHVDVLDFEGDIVIPRSGAESIVQRGVLITVLVGKQSRKTIKRTVRFRFRQTPFNSYLEFPYHKEQIESPYGSSPLMKGRTVQIAATDALNRLMDSGALKIAPPVGYDRTDMYFAQEGGPAIAPFHNWPTVSQVNVYDEVGGDPSSMAAIFANLVQLYYDVTGVQQPRLGQQTVSHTTAFAKGAELERGVVRTVDYVRNSLKGPLTKLLYMENNLLRKSLGSSVTPVFIPGFRAWMEVTRDALPDFTWYSATGASGPLEQARKQASRFNGAQQVTQLEILRRQLGEPPNIDISILQDAILSESGWTDIDSLKSDAGVSGSLQTRTQAAGQGNGAALPAAVQALSQGGQQV